jgi:acid phosphatase (class A)
MLMYSAPRRFWLTGVSTWLALLLLCPSVLAGDKPYLKEGHPDPIALLAPPPLPGSPEQAADLATVIMVHKQCSAADAAMAKSEKEVFIFQFAPIIGPFFQPGKLPKTEAFFERIHKDIKVVMDTAKDHWKRPRPYTVEPSLGNGEPENSFSYPSGHSTRATVYALVLAEIFPEKSEEILALGRGVGWRRVQIGRHYPTDIYAGRVLAQAIVRKFKDSRAFEKDLAEVKVEVAEAQRQK